MSEPQTISVDLLAERDRQGHIDIIDVRTPLEYREVYAVTARNIPLDALDPHEVMRERDGTGEQPLYPMCRGGARGAKARQRFLDAGFANIINVEGGTEAWVVAGLPVVRGKKAVSLERQVRIAIGTSLVIIAVTAAVGFAKYEHYLLTHDMSVDARAIATFVAIGIVGSLIGKSINARLNQRALRRVFAVFLILLGTFVIVREGSKLVSSQPSQLSAQTTSNVITQNQRG